MFWEYRLPAITNDLITVFFFVSKISNNQAATFKVPPKVFGKLVGPMIAVELVYIIVATLASIAKGLAENLH